MILEEFIQIDTSVQQSIHASLAWKHGIIPHTIEDDKILLYADTEKWNEEIKEELEILLGKSIEIRPTTQAIIQHALVRFYPKAASQNGKEISQYKEGIKDDFIQQLIDEAYMLGSSDIHIETYEEKCRIRLRVDGKLTEKYILSAREYPALINKIKIKAHLDIAEKRLPQDGRIHVNSRGKSFDMRISILPTLHGEKVVMRLLNRDATSIEIEKLGMTEKQQNDFLTCIKKPHGILLISGPTGSGKTTTLYATLKILNKISTNILTVEDPVEYTLEGINQVQVKEDIGLSFSEALRSFLRQDPDIIMLGEIRDNQTAQMAIRAALTGHLVLSTIHTNSAWGTVSRLNDMGVPAYLLAGTMNMTAAQRLVRLLCPTCKKEAELLPQMLPPGFKPQSMPDVHYVSQGCEHCQYTGYKGRKAVYEIIPIDNELAGIIKHGESRDMDDVLKEKKIERLMDQAFAMMQSGSTSLEEVYSLLMSSY
ncbi:MAG: general secretion pathway protein GspE [Bacteroidota bacterium]|nr:MAG: general secretion pathway protein GspE [Bacteroidota bacterium]